MTHLFFKFYIIITCVILFYRRENFLADSEDVVKNVFFWFAFFVFTMSCISLNRLTSRVSLAVVILMAYMIKGNLFIHSKYIPWAGIALFLSFFDLKRPLSSTHNLLMVRLVQTYILSIYFCSGLWKVRRVLTNDKVSLSEIPFEQIAYSVAEGVGPSARVLELMLSWQPLIIVGYVLVVLFQFGSIIPIITQKYFKLWALFSVIFHLLTGFTLGIYFQEVLFASVFCLYIMEEFLDCEKEKAEVGV